MNRRGFTLVELLLSSVFFSFVLLLIIVGFLQITRTYTKGSTIKEIQSTTRSVLQDISRQVRVSDQGSIGTLAPSGSSPGALCAGNILYLWNHYEGGSLTTAQINGESFKLARVENAGLDCESFTEAELLAITDYEELLPENAQLQFLSANQILGTTTSITLVLSSLEVTDLESTGSTAVCKASVRDQYCSVSRLTTAVTARNAAD